MKRRYVNPLEDLEEDLVPESVLEGLKQNKKILGLLENAKLRNIITRIDASRDRIASLERQIQIDPAFAQVINDLAEAIGFKPE